MGVRDALLLNQTGSNFQALQTNDTARLKGDLSLQKDDGTEVLGIDVSAATLNLTGGITGSGNISSSLSSTGSFGRVVATTFHGDGSGLKNTLPRSANIVTASAQLSAEISGAFTAGFEFSSSISGSATSTGSFGRLEGLEFHGDGSGIKTTLPRSTGIITGSAQLAADISGSFNKGFEYVGIIKGGLVTAGGTWSAGGALASSISYHGAAGDKCGQIVAMGVSGNNSLGSLDATRTFEYNGSSWSEAGDNNTNRARAAGAGTVNSGLFFGGYAPNWYGTSQGATETYNGTNFSEVNNMIMPRRAHMGAGLSSEAALALGGYTDSAPVNPGFNPNMGKFTEVWNGTNWSESGDAPANMKRGGMVGSVNAAVMFGSNTDPDLTLHWDGSSWSEGGSGHAPNGIDATHGGTQNDAIRGTTGYVSPNVYTPATQYYNGLTWSEGPNMINAYAHRGMGHNQGNAAGALAAGGEHGVPNFAGQTATEEHTGGNAVISGSFGRLDATTITGDATPIISSLPFPSGLVSGSGILASDISGSFNKGFGLTGNITTPMDAWSTGHNMNVQRWYFGAKGYVDAAIAMGGRSTNPASEFNDETELWDGTSWTEVNDMSYGRTGGYGGTVESGYFSGGSEAPWSRSEEWNGTNWSEATAFGEREGDVGGCSPTQVYNVGSMYDGGQKFTKYNAGVCTEGPILSIGTCAPFGFKGASGRFGHAGNADCLLVFTCCFTEEYNGSSWSVLSHNTGEFDGRYQGFTDSNPNPAKLNGVCNKACSVRCNTGAGTTNDAYSYGGEVGPTVGPGWYANCSRAMFQRWDGISWSRGVEPPIFCVDGAQGIGDGSNAFVLGGKSYPGQAPHASVVYTSGSIFLEGQSSASFGLLKADKFSGNAASLQTQLPYSTNPSFGIISSSAQIAADISGSFNKGFEFSGQIKAATGGVFSLGTTMLEQQTGAVGGSMNKGTAFIAGGAYGTARDTCACHQQYNGTSWSEAADLNDARKQDLYAAGDSAGAIVHGGHSGPATHKTEEWNGSAWSEVNTYSPTYNIGAENTAAGESSEAALRWGLYDAAEWNGTNWSEISTTSPSVTGGHYTQAGTGTVNAALQFGGQSPNNFSSTGYDRTLRAFRAWDGSNWTECPNMIIQQYMQNAFGSANDAVSTGGSYYRRAADGAPSPFGGFAQTPTMTGVPSNCVTQYSQYWDGNSWSITGRLLTRVRGCCSGGSGYGGASGGGASNQGFVAGGVTPGSPYNTDAVQLFDAVKVSGSFGRLDATTFHGDGSGLTNVLPSNIVSGSAQIASRISGSFNKGFGIVGSGEISGSGTGSFGRIEADFIHGDGSSIKDSLTRSTGIVSGAAQIAADISGSFISGFEYEGLIQTSPGGVWNTATALNTPRTSVALVGHKGSAIAAGGPSSVLSETWDGSSWTETNDLPTAGERRAGFGVDEDAAVVAGGYPNGNQSYEWNGTNWSEVADLPSSQDFLLGAGSSTEAGIVFNGYPGDALEWNGSNWSEITQEPTTAIRGAASGESSEAAISTGGDMTPTCMATQTEIWNGSSWSEGGSLSIGRRYHMAGGTTNDAFVAGGNGWTPSGGFPSPGSGTVKITNTEVYDGTSWSETGDIPAAQSHWEGNVGACGKGDGMIVGSPSHYQFSNNVTSASFHNIEITNLTGDGSQFSASLQSQLLTSATQISNSISGSFNKGFDLQGGASASLALLGFTWVAGGNMNTPSTGPYGGGYGRGMWGTKASAIATGNHTPSPGNHVNTEEYNGTNWSEVNNLITGRGQVGVSGCTTESGLAFGGDPSTRTCTEVWNGNNWSEANDLPTAGYSICNAGTSTEAALAFGGTGGSDEWNGNNWSEITSPPVSMIRGDGTGESSDAAFGAGSNNSELFTCTEFWNGSAWTEGAALSVGRLYQGMSGTTNDALVVGGSQSPASPEATELYDGTAFTTVAELPSAGSPGRTGGSGGAGGSATSLIMGKTNSDIYHAGYSGASGSFGQLRGTIGGEIRTDMFNITSSTFKLPLFSDADLNYHSQEPEESTGSMSGSVARVGDVNVLNKPGNFFFHSDYNALGFTYVSSSVYSQSVDFVSCGYASGGLYTTSSGFITQSHYCYQNVIQYITGSYI